MIGNIIHVPSKKTQSDVYWAIGSNWAQPGVTMTEGRWDWVYDETSFLILFEGPNFYSVRFDRWKSYLALVPQLGVVQVWIKSSRARAYTRE